MIEVIQIGQAGRTTILMDMFRLRMKQRIEQPQPYHAVNDLGLEVDALDCPEAVYMLVVNDSNTLIGSWRLTPCPMNVWQISRFEVDLDYAASHGELEIIDLVAMELFDALADIAVPMRIKEVFFHYDDRFGRLLERIEFAPVSMRPAPNLNGREAVIGYFDLGPALQKHLRLRSGFTEPRVNIEALPDSLRYEGDLMEG